MKFCSKCGKELFDEAVICPNCGCATDSATPEQLDNHPIVKSSYGQLFKVCMLMGLAFGVFLGVFWSILGLNFLIAFLLGTLMFGLLMFGVLAGLVFVLEKSVRKKVVAKVALTGKIYFEGAANRSGNGGWLFVTQTGIEHHPHSANMNSAPTIIAHEDIVSIQKDQKKLAVQTYLETYLFVVSNIGQWFTLFLQCELTKDKVRQYKNNVNTN